MTQKQQCTSSAICWAMLVAFCSAALVDIVQASSVAATVDLNTRTESITLSSENPPESGFRLKFLQKPAPEPSTDNNDAGVHKKGELYLRHRDNEEDNNDSSVSSKSTRYRREDVNVPAAPVAGASKVITTNWGTYEEQAPVVVASASRTIDADADEEPIFSDEIQSRETPNEYGGPAGVGSISYEEYEDGRFEGRQFYPSRGGGYGGAEEQEQPEGYYRQKYYSTTPKAAVREEDLLQGEQSSEGAPNRPRYPNRGQYRTPAIRKEEPEESQGIMGFVEKAKTFYDIFRAMNSAWKSIEDRYRKNGEGIFLGDAQPQHNATTASPPADEPEAGEEKTTKNPRLKTKKRKTTTTKAPTTADARDDDEAEEQRSRRSSQDVTVSGPQTATTSRPATESSPDDDDMELESESESESESDTKSSESDASASSSSSSTAVAEGRYIKGDPLKGYYDFVITEGSYKFWAAFQVGTAILIIYSTFAAIYYSKVNPLVSDYDYIDYLGGGRSLSDDSDFVDTDAPAAVADDGRSKNGTTAGKGAQTVGGMARNQRQQQSSAGWFDWVPHAGHTLRFILEAIDKGYTEE